MQTFLILYLIAAMVATGLVIAGGLWTRHVRARETWVAPPGGSVVDLLFRKAPADVRNCAMIAVKRLVAVMRINGVRTDIAIPHGLLVRMTGAALTDLLEEILAAAVHHAPYGRVLMTATHSGVQVGIAVTDDCAGADPAERRASLRSMTERMALRGLVLDIDVRPDIGTSMTLRLPAAPPPGVSPTLPGDPKTAAQITQPTPIGSREIVDG